MRDELARVLVALVAIVVMGAAEEMLPKVLGCGVPLLLAMSVVATERLRMPTAVVLAATAGAFEDSLSGLPPMTSASFFIAAVVVARLTRMARIAAAIAFGFFQLWLAMIVPGLGGSVFARVLVALPFGAATALVMGWLMPEAERRLEFK